MRRLTWPAKAEDPGRKAQRAWVLLWEALNAYGAGDNAQTRRLHRTLRAHESVGLEELVPEATDGTTRWSLRESGGEVLLEEDEWLLLKTALQALRERKDGRGNAVVTGAHTEPLLFLDELLSAPPEVPKAEVEKPPS